MKLLYSIITSLSMLINSCSNAMPAGGKVEENVISSGESIIIKNKNGEISYSYSGETKRRIIVDGNSNEIEMIARSKRFRGKLGLYNPGERWLSSGADDARIVVVEGEMHFDTMKDALAYLKQGSEIMDWQSNDQGYVGGFLKSPERNQINITIYRYYLDGKPITTLPRGGGSVRVSSAAGS